MKVVNIGFRCLCIGVFLFPFKQRKMEMTDFKYLTKKLIGISFFTNMQSSQLFSI